MVRRLKYRIPNKCQNCGKDGEWFKYSNNIMRCLIPTKLRFHPAHPNQYTVMFLCHTCRWMMLETCREIRNRIKQRARHRKDWSVFT